MLKTPPLATPKPRLQFLRTTINSVTNHHSRRKIIRCQHSNTITNRKPRILCLHGFRTSGQIFKTQMNKWPQSVLNNLDLFFPDAPFDSNGKSGVEGVFDPPYYEWFQFHKDYKRYENFDECVEYIEECMIEHAPIDGLLGFSQGAILSAALAGLQAKGMALTRVPKIGFLMIISGAKLINEALAEKAYSPPLQCPSLHFLGDKDFIKPHGIELLKSFENPMVIHHPKGHTIPRLDEEGLETMLKFMDRIQKIVSDKEDIVACNNN
ncbi:putative dihydrofolate reductase [Helianthus annuus]|uniref:Dihydrofolate reductase n=1 Tax=Helianthus annuus TaxID=4232 RepID=A0A251VGX2_HELAN|nr:dihydrofolate reductase isoform X1 [Helianthus annuus]KAF5818612.1 putative dihydrofolate reductase [Helianthus annuus]KAJ0615501.1 putative dihydrofolate reductase [Helianthus annuus]KAJ0618883.1 putative dihydrofolate reductase [Helianthus annuus]KAJ0951929.1 putative dihydrofolate reductase [Helianthus annuus]